MQELLVPWRWVLGIKTSTTMGPRPLREKSNERRVAKTLDGRKKRGRKGD